MTSKDKELIEQLIELGKTAQMFKTKAECLEQENKRLISLLRQERLPDGN